MNLIYLFLPCLLCSSYLQSNGYKPSPLDCSGIQLTEKMLDLVELMAENTHNVWSQDRIQQEWTYGLNEVLEFNNNCVWKYCSVIL